MCGYGRYLLSWLLPDGMALLWRGHQDDSHDFPKEKEKREREGEKKAGRGMGETRQAQVYELREVNPLNSSKGRFCIQLAT